MQYYVRMVKALFLDRDGVINKDFGYVHVPSNFIFEDGIFELIRNANSFGLLVIVVTNQAGIARGYYDVNTFNLLTEWMLGEFRNQLCKIDAVYFCPYHPEGVIDEYREDHFDRKPKPGMFLRAEKDFSIDMKKSILIGNKISDIEAGLSSGVGTNFLYLRKSGHETIDKSYQIIEKLTDVLPYLNYG